MTEGGTGAGRGGTFFVRLVGPGGWTQAERERRQILREETKRKIETERGERQRLRRTDRGKIQRWKEEADRVRD